MIISRFILKKIFYSFLLCLFITFSIFFIVSLLGNLNENLLFNKIIYLSLISSVQIIFYIPIFIFFLTLVIFFNILKNKNEHIILFHYLSKKIFYIYLFFFIVILGFIEINKSIITNYFENIKLNLTTNDTFFDKKVIVEYNDTSHSYYLLSQVNKKDFDTINVFKVENNSLEALYSSNVFIYNNNIMANGYYKLKENSIEKFNDKKILLNEIEDFLANKNKINYIRNNTFNFNAKEKIFEIFIVISAINLLLFLFMSKTYYIKNTLNYSIYLKSILVIFYIYFILNLKVSEFQLEFNFLAIILIITLFLKNIIYD